MKKCPVCRARNSDYAVICKRCKRSFSQSHTSYSVPMYPSQTPYQQQYYMPPQQQYYVPQQQYYVPVKPAPKSRGARTAAQVFLILGMVLYIFLFPACVMMDLGGVPVCTFMCIVSFIINLIFTIVHGGKMKEDSYVGIGFKIFTLLFVNLIAGILMLCDSD